MNKKTFIAIIILIVIIVGVAIYAMTVNRPKELNLEELNTKIARNGSI